MTEVPAPLGPFGQQSIRKILKKNLPPTPRESRSQRMRTNLLGYERLAKKQLKEGVLSPDSVVVCELGRGFGKPYRPCMSVDISPCLRTSLRHLFILSVGDIHKPDHDREFCRWMLPYERLSLQGSEPAVATTLRGDHLIHACGNAYPVNLVAACLVPILHALADSSSLSPSDLAPKTREFQPCEGDLELPDSYGFFQGGLKIKKPGKKPNKKLPAKRPSTKPSPRKKTMKSAVKGPRAAQKKRRAGQKAKPVPTRKRKAQ